MKLINPITIIVFATFVLGFLFLEKNKKINFELFLILLCSISVEVISTILLLENSNISLIYSIGFLIHNSLWISILFDVFRSQLLKKLVLVSYIVFAIINFLFLEKKELNNMTFVIGAMLYILFFIIEIFKYLKKEKLDFFSTTEFLLILAPILFFFGFSLIFSFKNSEIRIIKIFNKIELYTLICYTINIIYYFIINLYIYKEYKQKNVI